jgi:hypothetical protein
MITACYVFTFSWAVANSLVIWSEEWKLSDWIVKEDLCVILTTVDYIEGINIC